jgi:hypothetical protein
MHASINEYIELTGFVTKNMTWLLLAVVTQPYCSDASGRSLCHADIDRGAAMGRAT